MAEKLIHHLKIRREIQARFWEKNKLELNLKRRNDRKELKQLRLENNELKNQVHAAEQITPILLGKRKEPEPEPVEEHEPGTLENNSVLVPPPKRNGKIITTQAYCIQMVIEDKKWTPYNADGKRNAEPIQCGGIKRFFHITGSHDMNKSLQKYDKIEKQIREGKKQSSPDDDYSINSRRGITSMILYASDNIPGIMLSTELKEKYKTLNDLYSIMSKEQTEENKLSESHSVMNLEVYLDKIKNAFGEDSKQFLIASLYKQVTGRDDFQLYIVDRLGKTNNKERNYLFMPRKGTCTIVLNHYKTAFRYKTYKKDVDSELTTLLRNYITKHKIDYDHLLFPEPLLGPFIKKMNKEIGVSGSINTIRHIVISDLLQNYKNMTPEQKLASARQAMHSHITDTDYVRLIRDV